MTKDEVLKLALEALEEINKLSIGENAICLPAEIDTAMDAIKEALAQPEQEPVGDFYITKDMAEHIKKLEVDWTICASGSKRPTEKKVVPVFVGNTTPPQQELVCVCGAVWEGQELIYTTPQRKPLTDEELRVIENKINPNMRWRSSDEEGITLYPIEYYELVRAIEAAHGIKGEA